MGRNTVRREVRLIRSEPKCWATCCSLLCGSSGERKPGAPRSTVSGFHKECFVQFGRGHETRRPKNTFLAVLVKELKLLWAGRAPAVSWVPEWKPFEILVWADSIFLISSSTVEIARTTQEIAEVFGRKKACI